MVVHAQVEERIVLGGVDKERCALLAALVAAGSLARFHRGHQPLGEGERVRRLVGAHGLVHDLRAREHVARDRKAAARSMAAPFDAMGAGVRGSPPRRVDHLELAHRAAAVGLGEAAHHVLGRRAGIEEGKPVARIKGIDQRLGRQGALAGAHRRTQGPDGKEFACDSHTERAGGVACHDRPGHARDSTGRYHIRSRYKP